MIFLKILALLVIIGFCMYMPIVLVVGTSRKKKPLSLLKNGKRELAVNQMFYIDYLTVLIPLYLLCVGLFSGDFEERNMALAIAGAGYTVLVLSPYNRRIDILKINFSLAVTSAVMALTSFYLLRGDNLSEKETRIDFGLCMPALAYIFVMSGRLVVRQFTDTYPITIDKNMRVGSFYERYNRRVTWWDFAWSMFMWVFLIASLWLVSYAGAHL